MSQFFDEIHEQPQALEKTLRWAEEKNLIPGNFTRANKVTSTE